MAFFKITRHSPQWDNLDLCTDNPHRAGPENLNNPCGQLVVARGPLVGFLFGRLELWMFQDLISDLRLVQDEVEC
jgi:hypothetical protein